MRRQARPARDAARLLGPASGTVRSDSRVRGRPLAENRTLDGETTDKEIGCGSGNLEEVQCGQTRSAPEPRCRPGSDNLVSVDIKAGAGKEPRKASRREELFAFVVLAILIWPILAVGVVGSYGFLIWAYQMAFGPPGPSPSH